MLLPCLGLVELQRARRLVDVGCGARCLGSERILLDPRRCEARSLLRPRTGAGLLLRERPRGLPMSTGVFSAGRRSWPVVESLERGGVAACWRDVSSMAITLPLCRDPWVKVSSRRRSCRDSDRSRSLSLGARERLRTSRELQLSPLRSRWPRRLPSSS